jgi:ribosomal protein L11 methyltransferase
VGTGTGILALAMAKLGAEVLAVDIDDEALAAAEENVRLNDLRSQVRVEETLVALVKGPFHLVAANVTFADQLQLAQTLTQRLLPEGILVVSGFLEGDVQALQVCYANLDLQTRASLRRDNWVAMILGRSHWRA